MRMVALIAAVGAFALPVFAQEVEPESDEPLSELDRLSRSADDPFAGANEVTAREPVSVTLRALDKITARYADIEIPMNEIALFGSLEIQPRTCDKRPPEEFPETTAFLEIFDKEFGNRESDLKVRESEVIEDDIAVEEIGALDVQPVGELPTIEEEPAPVVLEGPQAEGVNIFRGWMFASAPALNALEHPVYDVWVIDCKTRSVGN